MRILVTGANGQLGNEMQMIKKPFGHTFLRNRLM